MTPGRACLAVVSLCLAVAGCGGSGAGSTQAVAVKRTVQASLADLARANGVAFCSLTTPSGRAQLARTLHGYGCAQLIEMVGRHLSSAYRAALLHVRVTRVAVHGSVATVSAADIVATQGTLKGFLSDGGHPTVLLRQPDGSWRITAGGRA